MKISKETWKDILKIVGTSLPPSQCAGRAGDATVGG